MSSKLIRIYCIYKNGNLCKRQLLNVQIFRKLAQKERLSDTQILYFIIYICKFSTSILAFLQIQMSIIFPSFTDVNISFYNHLCKCKNSILKRDFGIFSLKVHLGHFVGLHILNYKTTTNKIIVPLMNLFFSIPFKIIFKKTKNS